MGFVPTLLNSAAAAFQSIGSAAAATAQGVGSTAVATGQAAAGTGTALAQGASLLTSASALVSRPKMGGAPQAPTPPSISAQLSQQAQLNAARAGALGGTVKNVSGPTSTTGGKTLLGQ